MTGYHFDPKLIDSELVAPRIDWARRYAESLHAETERWIWKAIAEGVGNRVWRSNPIHEPWPSTVTRYQFAILRPGEPSPTGVVFGPFSKAN